jgi:hypothetical protein
MSDFELTDHIATKDEINQACDRSQRVVVLTEASQLTPADSDKIFMLNATAEFATTLPAVADAGAGWKCKFVVQAAPSSASYTIVEDAVYDTDVIIVNGINELEVDTSDDGPYSSGCTTISFYDGVAVAVMAPIISSQAKPTPTAVLQWHNL